MKEFHFHAQNLNEDKFNRKGTMLKHGRCWWFFGRKCLGFEWRFSLHPHFRIGATYGGGGDEELSIQLSLLFMSLYLNFENFFKKLRKGEDKHTGIAIFDGYLELDLNQDENDYIPERDKFSHIMINIPDLIFGREKYNKTELKKAHTDIPMPEGSYPASITIAECTWKRPRLLFKKIIKRAEVEMERGIPVPGKGEEEWDLDDDAVYGLTLPGVDSIESAIGKTVETCMHDRIRIGGCNWRPSTVEA